MQKQLKINKCLGIGLLIILILGMIVSSAKAKITPLGKKDDSLPGKFAVLIAIDRYYDGTPQTLQYCKSDTLALKETLIAGGFQEDNIILMTDDTEEMNLVPTKENIRSTLTKLGSRAEEDDMIFFFFSGHGVLSDGIHVLMPIDIKIYRNQLVGGLRVQEVLDTLGKSKAKTRLIVMDACISVPMDSSPVVKPETLPLPPRTALFLSVRGGHRSYESSELQSSIFAYYMIRGLQGEADKIGDENGKVDLTELFHYVKSHMAKHNEFQRQDYAPGLLVSNDMEDIFGMEIVDLRNSKKAEEDIAAEKGYCK